MRNRSSHLSGSVVKMGVLTQPQRTREGACPREGWRRGPRGLLRKSCDVCTLAKTRCSGGVPCNRCKNRGRECIFSERQQCGPRKSDTSSKNDNNNKRRQLQLSSPSYTAAAFETTGTTGPISVINGGGDGRGGTMELESQLKPHFRDHQNTAAATAAATAVVTPPVGADGLPGLLELLSPSLSDPGYGVISGRSSSGTTRYDLDEEEPRRVSFAPSAIITTPSPRQRPLNHDGVSLCRVRASTPCPDDEVFTMTLNSSPSSTTTYNVPLSVSANDSSISNDASIMMQNYPSSFGSSFLNHRQLTQQQPSPPPPQPLPCSIAMGDGCVSSRVSVTPAMMNTVAATPSRGSRGGRTRAESPMPRRRYLQGEMQGRAKEARVTADPSGEHSPHSPGSITPCPPSRGPLPLDLGLQSKAHLRTFMRRFDSVVVLPGSEALQEAMMRPSPRPQSRGAGGDYWRQQQQQWQHGDVCSSSSAAFGGGGQARGGGCMDIESRPCDDTSNTHNNNSATTEQYYGRSAGAVIDDDGYRQQQQRRRSPYEVKQEEEDLWGLMGGDDNNNHGGGGGGGVPDALTAACRAEAWAAVAVGAQCGGARSEEANGYASRALRELSSCLDAPLPEVASVMVLLALFWIHSMEQKKAMRYFGFAQQIGKELGELMPKGLRLSIEFASALFSMTFSPHEATSDMVVQDKHIDFINNPAVSDDVTMQSRYDSGATPPVSRVLIPINLESGKLTQDAPPGGILRESGRMGIVAADVDTSLAY